MSAGFNGRASRDGALDGAVSVDTADLRGLMAWLGKPLGSGGGLKRFKASGIFGVAGETISFEETRFTLDDTSGEANGRIVLGGKPSVTARLDLRELVLTPISAVHRLRVQAAAVVAVLARRPEIPRLAAASAVGQVAGVQSR